MSFDGFKLGGWPLLAGWIFPSLIFVGVLLTLVLPGFAEQPWAAWILKLAFSEQIIVCIAGAGAIGIVLSSCSKPLYRILEGYLYMPGRLKKAMTERHHKKREVLLRSYEKAKGTPGQSVAVALLLEKCAYYPVQYIEVAPTEFGNVLRAAETYGWDRYQLDVVTFWSGLSAYCPEALRISEERSKTNVDFFVASFYLSILACVAALCMMVSGKFIAGGVYFVVSVMVFVGSYVLAISAAKSWGSEIRTVADVGRVGLLNSLGLEKPVSLHAEREQWRALGWLRTYSFGKSRRGLELHTSWMEPDELTADKCGEANVSHTSKAVEEIPSNRQTGLAERIGRWVRR